MTELQAAAKFESRFKPGKTPVNVLFLSNNSPCQGLYYIKILK